MNKDKRIYVWYGPLINEIITLEQPPAKEHKNDAHILCIGDVELTDLYYIGEL